MRFFVLTIFCIVVSAVCQAKVFKISTEYPDGTSVLNELRRAAGTIEQQTEGRITFKFYPGGVMGDANAVLRKIRIGQLHGSFIHSGALASDFPDSQVLNAPLLFRDFAEVDAVRKVLDPEIDKGFLTAGWQTFGPIEGGFAYAMTNVPTNTMAMLRQQKIWLPANDPLSARLAKAFDINPIVLNIGDVLGALQTGAINAVIVPPVGAIALQWQSKTQYLTDAPFMYIYGVLAINKRYLNGISAADRAVLVSELTTASQRINQQARKDNKAAFQALQELGLKIVEPSPATRVQLEKESQMATKKLIASGAFSQRIYDQVTALLKSYRND